MSSFSCSSPPYKISISLVSVLLLYIVVFTSCTFNVTGSSTGQEFRIPPDQPYSSSPSSDLSLTLLLIICIVSGVGTSIIMLVLLLFALKHRDKIYSYFNFSDNSTSSNKDRIQTTSDGERKVVTIATIIKTEEELKKGADICESREQHQMPFFLPQFTSSLQSPVVGMKDKSAKTMTNYNQSLAKKNVKNLVSVAKTKPNETEDSSQTESLEDNDSSEEEEDDEDEEEDEDNNDEEVSDDDSSKGKVLEYKEDQVAWNHLKRTKISRPQSNLLPTFPEKFPSSSFNSNSAPLYSNSALSSSIASSTSSTSPPISTDIVDGSSGLFTTSPSTSSPSLLMRAPVSISLPNFGSPFDDKIEEVEREKQLLSLFNSNYTPTPTSNKNSVTLKQVKSSPSASNTTKRTNNSNIAKVTVNAVIPAGNKLNTKTSPNIITEKKIVRGNTVSPSSSTSIASPLSSSPSSQPSTLASTSIKSSPAAPTRLSAPANATLPISAAAIALASASVVRPPITNPNTRTRNRASVPSSAANPSSVVRPTSSMSSVSRTPWSNGFSTISSSQQPPANARYRSPSITIVAPITSTISMTADPFFSRSEHSPVSHCGSGSMAVTMTSQSIVEPSSPTFFSMSRSTFNMNDTYYDQMPTSANILRTSSVSVMSINNQSTNNGMSKGTGTGTSCNNTNMVRRRSDDRREEKSYSVNEPIRRDDRKEREEKKQEYPSYQQPIHTQSSQEYFNVYPFYTSPTPTSLAVISNPTNFTERKERKEREFSLSVSTNRYQQNGNPVINTQKRRISKRRTASGSSLTTIGIDIPMSPLTIEPVSINHISSTDANNTIDRGVRRHSFTRADNSQATYSLYVREDDVNNCDIDAGGYGSSRVSDEDNSRSNKEEEEVEDEDSDNGIRERDLSSLEVSLNGLPTEKKE